MANRLKNTSSDMRLAKQAPKDSLFSGRVKSTPSEPRLAKQAPKDSLFSGRVKSTPTEQGQAVFEYVLMVFIVFLLLGAIRFGVNRQKSVLLKEMVCKIAAPCPGCDPGDQIRNGTAGLGTGNCGPSD
jgi:hypothetical protein